MMNDHRITLAGIPDLVRLNVHAEPQQSAEWCWAACCCGIARFLALPIQPTEAGLANLLTGRTDCDLLPTPRECIVSASAAEVVGIYDRLGISRVGPDLPLSINTLLAELIAGRPVEVGFMWYRGGGHVALVTGFTKATQRLHVSDPLFGDGQLTYLEIANGYGIGRWALSYGRFAKT